MLKTFRTYQLARKLYTDCQTLKLQAPLKDQFDRAVLSVVLNLAEGYGKPTAKDRKRFYAIAMGSLREVQTILDIKSAEQYTVADQLAGHLYKLMQNPGASG